MILELYEKDRDYEQATAEAHEAREAAAGAALKALEAEIGLQRPTLQEKAIRDSERRYLDALKARADKEEEAAKRSGRLAEAQRDLHKAWTTLNP